MLITDNKLLQQRPALDGSKAEGLADGFRALGDPHRLRILYLLLTSGEMCACEIMLAMEIPQSNLSFHMKTLKQAGFVNARKSGRWMYYSLSRPVFERFLTAFGGVFDLERWPDKPHCTACSDKGGICRCR